MQFRFCGIKVIPSKLKRGNFCRKKAWYVILEKQDETRRSGTPHKAPNLYKLDVQKYKDDLDGLHGGW